MKITRYWMGPTHVRETPFGVSILARLFLVTGMAVVGLGAAGCFLPGNPHKLPDPTMPATVVNVASDRPWTNTGITVKRGDSIFFTATGDVFWTSKQLRSTPDGIKGRPGWHVGAGGLLGRVADSKPFDIGARTQFFPDMHARPPHHPYPPPPLKMPRDGELLLGFKDFTPGENQGAFQVTIRYERR